MGKAVCLLLLVVSLGGLDRAIAEEDVPMIEFMANGWLVIVIPNGQVTVARAKEADEIFSTVQLPARTVNFSDLQKALKADLEMSTPVTQNQITAGIRMAGQQTLTPKPLHDVTIWSHLIENLQPALEARGSAHFKHKVEKNPLKNDLNVSH
jgi:hypothetical protein